MATCIVTAHSCAARLTRLLGREVQLPDWELLSTYVLGDICEMVNKPFYCWSPQRATGHSGPSLLLLLSPPLVLYTPQCDLTARCARHHRVTICKAKKGLNVEKRRARKRRRRCWKVYLHQGVIRVLE